MKIFDFEIQRFRLREIQSKLFFVELLIVLSNCGRGKVLPHSLNALKYIEGCVTEAFCWQRNENPKFLKHVRYVEKLNLSLTSPNVRVFISKT